MKVENLPAVASEGAVFTVDGVEHVFYKPGGSDYYCQHCPYFRRGPSARTPCTPCNEVERSVDYGVMPLTLFVTRALDKD